MAVRGCYTIFFLLVLTTPTCLTAFIPCARFLVRRGVPCRVTVFLVLALWREELLDLNHIFFSACRYRYRLASRSFAATSCSSQEVLVRYAKTFQWKISARTATVCWSKGKGKYLFQNVISKKCKIEIHLHILYLHKLCNYIFTLL